MDAAGSARARPFGNSVSINQAMRPPASIGAKAPSRSGFMSARPNGKRRRACGCGAMARRRWTTHRPAISPARGGERLTLLGSGVSPMTGRVALSRLVQLIEGAPGRASATDGLPLFEPLPRAGQLVLIGDFLAPLDTINATIAQFAGAGLKGHLLHIADPAEEELPFAGRIRFAGVEERDEIVISRVETVREDYALRFRRHREGLADIARAVGWTFGQHRTDRPPHLALLALHAALATDRRR